MEGMQGHFQICLAGLTPNIHFTGARKCRNLSTINYCMHGGVIQLLTKGFDLNGINSSSCFFTFCLVEIIVFATGFFALSLADRGNEKVRKVISLLY